MPAALFPDLVINGETIPHSQVAAEAQNHSGPAGKPGIAWRKAARAVAIRTLLLQQARYQGIDPAPQDLGAGRRETEEEALIRCLLDTAIEIETPTEEDIRTEWARDPGRFRAPPLWEVSHILVACDPRDQEASSAARHQADALLERVLANPRDFARIAAEVSDCGSKSAGGALGQLGPGDTVPEFERALRDLEDGEITQSPIQSRHGWHIIRMDACARGEILPYEGARPRIAEALEKARWSGAAKSYVDQLVSEADVTGVTLQGEIE